MILGAFAAVVLPTHQGVTVVLNVMVVLGLILLMTRAFNELPVNIIFPAKFSPAPCAEGVAAPLTVIPAVPPFKTEAPAFPPFTPPESVTIAVVPLEIFARVALLSVNVNPLVKDFAEEKLKLSVLSAPTTTALEPGLPVEPALPICKVPELILVPPL